MDSCGEPYECMFVEENGKPLLGAIVYPGEEGVMRSSPRPFTMYQGVLFADAVDALPPHTRSGKQLALTDFLLTSLEKKYASVEFCLHWSFSDIRSFSWFHYHDREKGMFEVTVGYTGLLNLRAVEGEEALVAAMRLNRRREVKGAATKGWRTKDSKDVQLLDDLHKKTFDRQDVQRPKDSGALVQSIARAALNDGFGDLLVSENNQGNVASALLALYDDRCGYYLVGANDPEFRKDACGTSLMLDAMLRAKKRGCSHFDFVGINSPTRGDYKISFNAVPVPYYIVRWHNRE